MLVVYYYRWDEDPNMQSFSSQDFVMKLEEIAKTMSEDSTKTVRNMIEFMEKHQTKPIPETAAECLGLIK